MRPTLLDRYFLWRTGVVLLQTLVALTAFYVLIDFLAGRAAIIRANEVPWTVVGLYYAASLPELIVRYMAPFAMLVTGLLVVGDAAQNNEVTAALAGGISLRRLVRAPVIAAAVFAVGLFAMQESVGIAAARKAEDLDENHFSNLPDTDRMSVSWANLSGPWTCHILKYNPRAMTGENVLIYALTPEVHYQIEAERIFWDPEAEQWMIERGRWREFDPKTSRQLLSYGDTRITLRPAPFTEPPGELFSLEQPPETKTARTLRRDLAHAEARGLHAAPYAMGYHLKYAQPAMPFVMIWLAIPFAMRLRRGGLAIGFGAAIALALSYQLVFFVASGLGFMGAIDPVWAAWLPNGLALALGVTLFSRIPT